MALKSIPWLNELLAQQHAQNQEGIAAQLALDLLPLWAILKPNDLNQSTVMWLSVVMPLIAKAYAQSQRYGLVFNQDYKWASLPLSDPLPLKLPDVPPPNHVIGGAFDQVPIDFQEPLWDNRPFPLEQATKNMVVNGPSRVMSLMSDETLDEAMQTGLHTSSGAAIRQAVNGSRAATRDVAENDSDVLGWARVTDSHPCYYCAILASRGAVYKSNSFKVSDANFVGDKPKGLDSSWSDVAKVHDNCRCTLRPVYMKAQFRDREAWFYYEQWKTFSKGMSNAKAIRNFRKNFQEYPRDSAKIVNFSDLQDRRSSLVNAGFKPDSPQVRWTDNMEQRLSAA
jgi:hypothetical protein